MSRLKSQTKNMFTKSHSRKRKRSDGRKRKPLSKKRSQHKKK